MHYTVKEILDRVSDNGPDSLTVFIHTRSTCMIFDESELNTIPTELLKTKVSKSNIVKNKRVIHVDIYV